MTFDFIVGFVLGLSMGLTFICIAVCLALPDLIKRDAVNRKAASLTEK